MRKRPGCQTSHLFPFLVLVWPPFSIVARLELSSDYLYQRGKREQEFAWKSVSAKLHLLPVSAGWQRTGLSRNQRLTSSMIAVKIMRLLLRTTPACKRQPGVLSAYGKVVFLSVNFDESIGLNSML